MNPALRTWVTVKTIRLGICQDLEHSFLSYGELMIHASLIWMTKPLIRQLCKGYLRYCWLHKMYLFLGRAQTGYFLKWAQSVTYTWATKVQVSLCKCPISSGPLLLAHTKYGLRGSTRLLEILVQWMAGQADLNGQIWNIDTFHVTWLKWPLTTFMCQYFDQQIWSLKQQQNLCKIERFQLASI